MQYQLSDGHETLSCHCLLVNQAAQIAELKEQLAQLTTKPLDISSKPPDEVTQLDPPTNTIVKSNKSKLGVVHPDKMFNIVVYGIDENPPETKRDPWVKHDPENLISSLLDTNKAIESHAIKDLY